MSLALLYKTPQKEKKKPFHAQVTRGNKDVDKSSGRSLGARGLSCGEARKQDSGRLGPEIIPNPVSSAHVEFLCTEQDENERKRCRGGRECLCLKMLVLS